jgi:hypothetical protein
MISPAPHRRLILDAVLHDASITGTLTGPSGLQREFHGWIELGTAIEALLGERSGSVPDADLSVLEQS